MTFTQCVTLNNKIMAQTDSPYPKTQVYSHYVLLYNDQLLRHGVFSLPYDIDPGCDLDFESQK